jgi:fibronectin type 3 domain-containing protein
MKNWIVGLALLMMAGLAHAQTTCVVGAAGTAPTASITFVAPTTNTDSTAIATPLTYNLYQSTTTGTEVKTATGIKGAPLVVATGLLDGVTYYWKITVVDANGNESALSNEVCKKFPAGVPGAVTITVT